LVGRSLVVVPGRPKDEPGTSRFSDVQLHIIVRLFETPRNDGFAVNYRS
jgi:hypothetical protein